MGTLLKWLCGKKGWWRVHGPIVSKLEEFNGRLEWYYDYCEYCGRVTRKSLRYVWKESYESFATEYKKLYR